MEIIDKCDEVENLILAKYVMIKAIKSLYFEHMSYLEKNESIFEKLRKQIEKLLFVHNRMTLLV